MTTIKHCVPADVEYPHPYQMCNLAKDGPLGLYRAVASYRRVPVTAPQCTLDCSWRVCA